MTAELLTSLSGILLSLLASYLPGFSTWFNALAPTDKRLIILAMLFVASLASYGLACSDPAFLFGLDLACDRQGAVSLLRCFVGALIANQAAFLVTPRPSHQRHDPTAR